ncbi:hypothetical protein ABFE35_001118 [Salmonella enterica]|nr:hypothetical protein [Salmonella enterica]EJO9712172.1 hypothetical protein [Salmonella enterica]EJO9737247.1 hypothetical protein [Salmonella enterica]EJO9832273.1 hypothetical protein [Salmonella enterica]EJP0938995.1 hypothetical protein [Salmonella enterica]
MPLVLLWIFLAVVLGFLAKGAGRSFRGWFILAMIIDPILAGLLFFLIVRD